MIKLKSNFEESNFYHVLTRGIAKQIIFEENSDNEYFLELLRSYSKKYKIKIICYCLMINHVHILCQDIEGNISDFMCILCSTYARYFNKKYSRVGSLFQRPFKKINIKNDQYFLSVFRYIILNPQKDKICNYQSYKWSSYKYLKIDQSFVDSTLVYEMLCGADVDSFLQHQDFDTIDFDDYENNGWTFSNFEALEIVKTKYNIPSASIIRTFGRDKRNKIILELRDLGLSIRQIERITGVSRGIVQHIAKTWQFRDP